MKMSYMDYTELVPHSPRGWLSYRSVFHEKQKQPFSFFFLVSSSYSTVQETKGKMIHESFSIMNNKILHDLTIKSKANEKKVHNVHLTQGMSIKKNMSIGPIGTTTISHHEKEYSHKKTISNFNNKYYCLFNKSQLSNENKKIIIKTKLRHYKSKDSMKVSSPKIKLMKSHSNYIEDTKNSFKRLNLMQSTTQSFLANFSKLNLTSRKVSLKSLSQSELLKHIR